VPKRSQTNFKKTLEEDDDDDSSLPLDESSVFPVMVPCIPLGLAQNAPPLKPSLLHKADHFIDINSDQFVPCFLKVYKGDIVQWMVSSKSQRINELGMLSFSNRQHVVSFDDLTAESHLLHPTSSPFQVKFIQTGVYFYRC
jgi:plastocyanin